MDPLVYGSSTDILEKATYESPLCAEGMYVPDLLHGQYERGADTGFSRLQELRKTGLHSMRMAPLQLPVLSPWAK